MKELLKLLQINGVEMSKRANFDRHPRDYYPTPYKAVEALIGYLPTEGTFIEPCAGNGALVDVLESTFGMICLDKFDLEPQKEGIRQFDATKYKAENPDTFLTHENIYVDYIITNPPFKWELLKPIIDNLLTLNTNIVLLLPADFMHNKRMKDLLKKCYQIVSIGRIKWIEDSPYSGKENYCWYFFNRGASFDAPIFYTRDL